MASDAPGEAGAGERAYIGAIGGPEEPLMWRGHVENAQGDMTSVRDDPSPQALVEWAQQQVTWVLVIGEDGLFYWAGSGDRPADVPQVWRNPDEPGQEDLESV